MKKINLKDFSSDKASIKYCCAKEAVNLSKIAPATLYPDFGFFVKMLGNDKNVLKWTACRVIGNLSKVDAKNKVDKVIPSLITLLSDKMMISAANAAYALAEIAENKPRHRTKILKALLMVEKIKYYHHGQISPECRNVVLGHVINCLHKFGPSIYSQKEVKVFLQRQTKNTRPKVREMAQKLFKNNV